VARIKHKRSENTDHVIALPKGQARYRYKNTQRTNRQESNECKQEHAPAPYYTQETHNNLHITQRPYITLESNNYPRLPLALLQKGSQVQGHPGSGAESWLAVSYACPRWDDESPGASQIQYARFEYHLRPLACER
jgi:hypothetical protein